MAMNDQPLVTCLCLTMAGRAEFLKRAFDCFASQTYSNRNLLVIGDSSGDTDELIQDRWGRHEPGLDVAIVTACEDDLLPLKIGDKRNLGCQWALGDLIAIWDDDDYSAPDRLKTQVRELQITGKAVTGFNCMKFTDCSNWWQFAYPDRGFVLGTSLLFRRDWWDKHPFEELAIGEDVRFSAVAHEANQLAEVPDLNLMYATIHAGNSSIKRTDQPGWRALSGFKWSGK